MPSDAFTNIVSLLRASEIPEDIAVEDMRTLYEGLGALVAPAADVTSEPIEVGGVHGTRHTPPEVDDRRTVLYLHGGGYAIGSPATHQGLTSHLASRARAVVFAADYRLAPEHPYPGALDDAFDAYAGLIASGVPAGSIVIAGDSAGGGLALATLMRIRDEDLAAPAGGFLISPWTDLTQSGESITSVTDDPLVNKPELDRWAGYYTAGGTVTSAADNPYVSPLFGDLSDLPPLLVHVGTMETLLDDSRRLAERATAAGADVSLTIAEGMIHVWHLFAGMIPESDEAIDVAAAWVITRTT